MREQWLDRYAPPPIMAALSLRWVAHWASLTGRAVVSRESILVAPGVANAIEILGRAWKAAIKFERRTEHLGYFDDPIDAARARDAAAIKRYGEFATLNFP